ncbi:MAG: hypothetical protein AAGA10_17480 [Bacteroidota bacterium]
MRLLRFRTSYVLFLVLLLISSSCDDNEAEPEPSTLNANFFFSGSTGTTSLDLVFTNNTVGEFTTATWDFGQNATPATATFNDRSEQAVSYELQSEAYSAEVTLTVEAADGTSDMISKSVDVPALVGVTELPTPSSCPETFEQNPDCYCQDPANVGNSLCMLVNTNNGDMETDGIQSGAGVNAVGAFWDLYGGREGANTIYTQVEAGGSKALKVDFQRISTSEPAPWAIQAVNEPDANDNGWATEPGKAYLVSVDVHASKSGMKIWLVPGLSANQGYGAIDENIPPSELEQGWNHVSILVENKTGRSLDNTGNGIRGELGMNFAENEGGVFHLDNYKLIALDSDGGGGNPISSTLEDDGIDFESADYSPQFEPFGGDVTSAVIDNPDMSGINTSTKVGEITQGVGVEPWAGVTFRNKLDPAIDLSNGGTFTMKVWSPAAGQAVNFKLEDSNDNNNAVEVEAITTLANEWEELTFTFPADATGNIYDLLIVFFNFNGDKNTATTHYFDDIRRGVVSSNLIGAGIDFENLAYDPQFEPFGGDITSQVIDNPDASGINTSAKVSEIVQGVGVEPWAGVTFRNTLKPAIDLTDGGTFTMKVWSPAIGQSVNFKLEDSNDNNNAVEIEATTTLANEWEELTFTFPADATGNIYDLLIVFFNFNGDKSSPTTHYFDDVIKQE